MYYLDQFGFESISRLETLSKCVLHEKSDLFVHDATKLKVRRKAHRKAALSVDGMQNKGDNETLSPVNRDFKTYNDLSSVYISEAGLYSLVMQSKVPFADKFRYC